MEQPHEPVHNMGRAVSNHELQSTPRLGCSLLQGYSPLLPRHRGDLLTCFGRNLSRPGCQVSRRYYSWT